jgi:hypothetical protein
MHPYVIALVLTAHHAHYSLAPGRYPAGLHGAQILWLIAAAVFFVIFLALSAASRSRPS